MKTERYLPQSVRVVLGCTFTVICAFAAQSTQAAPKVLQFTAGSATAPITANAITLDHKDLNAKATLKLIVTQVGLLFTTNPHPVGVAYDAVGKKWQIINEDFAAIPAGAIFNVLIPEKAVRVIGGAENSSPVGTLLTLQKKNASALLLQTHMMNPFTMLGQVYLGKNLGIILNTAPPFVDSWAVYNEDESAMDAVAYNVADVTKDGVKGTPYSFMFTTAPGNVSGDLATITNPLTDGKPGAVLFVGHDYTPANPGFFNEVAGVYYDGSHWNIFVEDGTPMPTGKSFVVDAFPAVTP